MLPPRNLPPPPHHIPLTYAVCYPKRNENATLLTNSAYTAAMEIMQFMTARIFKVLPKRVTPNNMLTFTQCYLHPLLPHLPVHSLLSLSFPPLKTPQLGAPSDKITEGYHLGYFVDFVAWIEYPVSFSFPLRVCFYSCFYISILLCLPCPGWFRLDYQSHSQICCLIPRTPCRPTSAIACDPDGSQDDVVLFWLCFIVLYYCWWTLLGHLLCYSTWGAVTNPVKRDGREGRN